MIYIKNKRPVFLSLFYLFRWARLELLAGLLQEVLLLSLSLSIIVDAINKLINPNHIEDPLVMIYLGIAGICIGLLGLFLFRGYHHDHNIGHEIVEQKKNDFVQSVYTTIQNLDKNQTNSPELISNDASLSLIEQKQKKRHDLILPSLNDTYTNAFIVADRIEKVYEKELRVPVKSTKRIRRNSRESMIETTIILNDNKRELDEEFQESRVYATLHALCLHSLVSFFFFLFHLIDDLCCVKYKSQEYSLIMKRRAFILVPKP